jgi:hypothetical protein
MEEESDVSQINEQITRLRKKKERLQNQKAFFFYKEAQAILGKKFSYELALSVLHGSWNTSSDKQKEEWSASAHKFRRIPKQKSKGTPSTRTRSSQSSLSQNETPRSRDSQNTTENP